MSKTLNQRIKDMAFDRAVDYKPWEDDLEPQRYYEAGFACGATHVCEYEPELVPVKMYQVKVFDDHEGREPRVYTVPACTSVDAQLMAFLLDGGCGSLEGGGVVERGEMELARMHTEIIGQTRV